MQLHEARSRIQVLLNFYKGLAHIEEVIALAESAERLQKERTEAVEVVGRKLEEANNAYSAACETHGKLLENMRTAAAEMERKAKVRMEQIEEQVAAAEAQKVAAIAVARTKQAEAEHEAEEAIAFLTQRKAVLEKDVKQLEAALDKLKAKVGAL